MPFCPNCKAEYRAGFKTCSTCDDEPLVDVLPEDLRPDEIASAVPVTPSGGSGSELVEIDGVTIDSLRVFVLQSASELKRALDKARIPAAIVPLSIELADQIPRFEVRVRKPDQARAEARLSTLWKEQAEEEGVEATAPKDVETCPACGAHVPLAAHECPDCGLVVGAGGENDEAGAGEAP